jgi:asparagine synthase (glutamine-hydrolysing)
MSRILRHRGPDARGFFRDESTSLTLAHRRLSILDLEGGTQPMATVDRSLTVVFNGEIFNAPLLRTQLENRGHTFISNNADAEVLLHFYRERGVGMLTALRGMFAFALYDAEQKLIFCARDRLGIKPFYWARQKNRFAFASELKALIALPWVSRQIDEESLYHYIGLQFVPAPKTIFSAVKKLPKGHYLIYDLATNDIHVSEYWNLRFQPEQQSLDKWKRLIRAKIENAVNAWSLSDVPIACSLSGGLDSSSVVGLLAGTGKAVHTYSLGFKNAGGKYLDELLLAEQVARKWQTDHHEIIIDADRFLTDLPRMVYHLDEPFAGGLPSWYVFEQIGRDCKVAMTGIGGDELFGNYAKWRRFEKGTVYLERMERLELKHWAAKARRRHAELYPFGHYYYRYFSDAAKNEILFAHPPDGAPTEALLQQLRDSSHAGTYRDAVAYVDFQLQLPEEFLLVADRFAMAHAVEARVPLLDHELVALVFSIPSEIRTGDDPKYLLKAAMRDLLPAQLLNAPKRGFVLPLTSWTRSVLSGQIEETLSPAVLRDQGIFSEKAYYRIVKPHLMGEADYTQQVWTLFMFQLWYKEFAR